MATKKQATSTETASQAADLAKTQGGVFAQLAIDLITPPSKGDPRFIESRTNNKEGVAGLAAAFTSNVYPSTLPPIVVAKDAAYQDGAGNTLYVIVAGLRRYHASIKAGVEIANTIIMPETSTIFDQVSVMLAENENRTELNPIARAANYKAFVSAYVVGETDAYSAEQTAKLEAAGKDVVVEIPDAKLRSWNAAAKKKLCSLLGVSANHVNETLELNNLIKPVKDAIVSGDLEASKVGPRGAKLTSMIDADGKPIVERQQAKLDVLLGKQKGSTRADLASLAAREAAAETPGGVAAGAATTTPAKPAGKGKGKLALVGADAAEPVEPLFKPTSWERKNILQAAKTPKYVKAFADFSAGKLTWTAAVAQMPWLEDVFVSEAGPGAVDE